MDNATHVTKTNAKHEYFLTETDLSKIPYETKKLQNRYGSCKLYDIEDIHNHICEKYGIEPEEIEHYLQKKTEEKNIKTQKRQNKKAITQELRDIQMHRELEKKNLEYDDDLGSRFLAGKYGKKVDVFITAVNQKNQRKEELVNALKAYGMVLRSDSELCKKYIDGDLNDTDWTVSDIVRRMCEMRYLYTYCHFQECKNQVYNEFRYDKYMMYQISDEAEKMALQKYSNGRYPSVFPWMTDNLL